MKKMNFLYRRKLTKYRAEVTCLIIGFVTLALGLMPYLFIRTSGTYISSFLNIFFEFKKISLDENNPFYIFATSYFSDLCWAFAMPFFLFSVTKRKFSRYFYIFSTPIVGGLLELFQFMGIIDGVGDIIDTIIYFSASFLGYITIERGVLNGKQTTEANL